MTITTATVAGGSPVDSIATHYATGGPVANVQAAAASCSCPVPWATQPQHSHLVTRHEQVALLERAGFRIDVWEDPTDEMCAVLRSMLAPPPPGATPPLLNPSLTIDDLPTKAARYFANMESGRTALVLTVCTAA